MATAYTWRLSADASFGHGYEVGQWPTGVDIRDANEFLVNERWYDQATAARRAVAFNIGVTPPAAAAKGSSKPPFPPGQSKPPA